MYGVSPTRRGEHATLLTRHFSIFCSILRKESVAALSVFRTIRVCFNDKKINRF